MYIKLKGQIEEVMTSMLQDYFSIMMIEKYGEDHWIEKIVEDCDAAIKKYNKEKKKTREEKEEKIDTPPGSYYDIVKMKKEKGLAMITIKSFDITKIHALLNKSLELRNACSPVQDESRQFFGYIHEINESRNSFAHYSETGDALALLAYETNALYQMRQFMTYLIQNDWSTASAERKEFIKTYQPRLQDLNDEILGSPSKQQAEKTGDEERKKIPNKEYGTNILVTDQKGIPIPGFRMVVKDCNTDSEKERWISSNVPEGFDLEEGIYSVETIEAPLGYIPTLGKIFEVRNGRTGYLVKAYTKAEHEESSSTLGNMNGNSLGSMLGEAENQSIETVLGVNGSKLARANSTAAYHQTRTRSSMTKKRVKTISFPLAILMTVLSAVIYVIPSALIFVPQALSLPLDETDQKVIICSGMAFFLIIFFVYAHIVKQKKIIETRHLMLTWGAAGLFWIIVYFVLKTYYVDASQIETYRSCIIICVTLLLCSFFFMQEHLAVRIVFLIAVTVICAALFYSTIRTTEEIKAQQLLIPIKNGGVWALSEALDPATPPTIDDIEILDDDGNGRYIARGYVEGNTYLVLFAKYDDKWHFWPKSSFVILENEDDINLKEQELRERVYWGEDETKTGLRDR